MSTHIPAELRRQVRARDGGLCVYCRSAETLMGLTFEVDHIVPLAADGKTELENLCVACPACNRHKAIAQSAVDPHSGAEVALYHPLRDRWEEHFRWSEDGVRLHGLTARGCATIAALRMNRPLLIVARRY